MLAANKYPRAYIDACKARVRTQVRAYKAMAKAAKTGREGKTDSQGDALQTLEGVFFNNMVIAMDAPFVHRTRALELKDGNPLNEVRILCNSMMGNDGRMAADKTIKMKVADSILGYEVGDRICLTDRDFARLSEAFFDEIEAKFS